MKYYLITLKDNQQFIVADNEMPKVDLFPLDEGGGTYSIDLKKVIAGLEGLPSISFSKLNQIPDTGAIRAVVDVDKLANDAYPADAKYKKRYNWIWKEGFYASQELKDELTEKEVEQTAIDFAMHFISSSDNIQLYMPKEFDYLQGLLLEQGAKIFKEFQDRPKIFEIEVEMEEYDEGGFSPEREPKIENNQIEITKILKRL